GTSAKVTANAPAIPDTRVMMFLLLRSFPPPAFGECRHCRLARCNTKGKPRQLRKCESCVCLPLLGSIRGLAGGHHVAPVAPKHCVHWNGFCRRAAVAHSGERWQRVR